MHRGILAISTELKWENTWSHPKTKSDKALTYHSRGRGSCHSTHGEEEEAESSEDATSMPSWRETEDRHRFAS